MTTRATEGRDRRDRIYLRDHDRAGVKYAPLLDRLERELAAIKRDDDPISRARRHLARARGRARTMRMLCRLKTMLVVEVSFKSCHGRKVSVFGTVHNGADQLTRSDVARTRGSASRISRFIRSQKSFILTELAICSRLTFLLTLRCANRISHMSAACAERLWVARRRVARGLMFDLGIKLRPQQYHDR